MRIISQNGRFDFPYERSEIEYTENNLVMVNGKRFATYDTAEEVDREREDLREEYLAYNELYKFR